MAKIIAVLLPKGGVGKTVTAVNLAASLAVAEQRTLLIDLDTIGSSGLSLGLTEGRVLFLELGERRVFARFLGGQSREDRIAAVQYLRFPVGEDAAAREALLDLRVPAFLRIAHPNYQAATELSAETRRELARDLAAD